MAFFGGGGASASNMVGATSSAAGTAGLVPAPAAGDDGRVLNGDATFQSPKHATKLQTAINQKAIFLLDHTGNWGSSGSYDMYSDRQQFCPVFVPSTLTSWNLVFRTAAALASGNAIVGVYDYGTDTGLPKNRISKSASFSIVSAGATTYTTAFTDTLKRGIYFLTLSTSAVVKIDGHNVGNSMGALGYGDPAITGATNLRYSTTTFNSTDFPATIDTSKLSIEGFFIPRMWITY